METRRSSSSMRVKYFCSSEPRLGFSLPESTLSAVDLPMPLVPSLGVESRRVAALAGAHSRTAAPHWALSGSVARPECGAQPRPWIDGTVSRLPSRPSTEPGRGVGRPCSLKAFMPYLVRVGVGGEGVGVAQFEGCAALVRHVGLQVRGQFDDLHGVAGALLGTVEARQACVLQDLDLLAIGHSDAVAAAGAGDALQEVMRRHHRLALLLIQDQHALAFDAHCRGLTVQALVRHDDGGKRRQKAR
eukprot:scaffold98883_cov87-Phaeocystis_antarctica.AAC.4